VMPCDMAIMVDIANGVRQAVTRRIDFLHMPVPKDRTDAAYFRPLTQLTRSDDTTLYLGLVYHGDRDGSGHGSRPHRRLWRPSGWPQSVDGENRPTARARLAPKSSCRRRKPLPNAVKKDTSFRLPLGEGQGEGGCAPDMRTN
jgi:hypothetical protein